MPPANLNLTDRQLAVLKTIKRAPKTITSVHTVLVKKDELISKDAIRSCMRRLENNGLVRAREKFDKKLKREVILWELTGKGSKAVS